MKKYTNENSQKMGSRKAANREFIVICAIRAGWAVYEKVGEETVFFRGWWKTKKEAEAELNTIRYMYS